MNLVRGRLRCSIAAACCAQLLVGCVAEPDTFLLRTVGRGQHGRARTHLNYVVRSQPRPRFGTGRDLDRTYILNRMRLALVTLADGYVDAGDHVFSELYDILRTQGINRDKTVASVVLNEDLKTWKGEPFEQAMAFHYVAIHHAQSGEWDNVRAAADNSLFYLRDFGRTGDGARKKSNHLIMAAQEDERYLDNGYVAVATNFVLGYLLHGVASMQLGREKEAADYFKRVVSLDPSLAHLVDRFRNSRYNVILVVDYGRGPQKIGTGPDNAIAKFVARTPSDTRPLHVSTSDGDQSQSFPVVCDLNSMAADHSWNNLEDVRLAKSQIGTALMAAGALLTVQGQPRRRRELAHAGLGMMAAGLFAKVGAHADTRYCELLPQRVYLVPLWIKNDRTHITLQVAGSPIATMVLAGLEPAPASAPSLLRYVRLVWSGARPPAWANGGKIYYANESAPDGVTPNVPYILGGNCVRPPSEQALNAYREAGFLDGFSLGQLEDLYRLEGICIRARADRAQPGRHVLEGGKSLIAPAAGTAGFARIFGRPHRPYEPRSPKVLRLAERVKRRLRLVQSVAEPQVRR